MSRHFGTGLPASLLSAVFFAAAASAAPQDPIEQIKAERQIDYLKYGPKLPSTSPASHSYAVHLESRDSVWQKTTENQKTNSHIVRHPESAAYALDHGGRESTGLSIPTNAFDTDVFLGALGISETSSEDQKSIALNRWVIEHATVISISMTSDLSFLNPKYINEYRQFWKDSNAIVFQAAGNGGRVHCSSSKPDPALPSEYHYFALSDTYLHVGAATLKDEGKVMVAAYSGCTAADFFALNPYETGLKYQFVRKENELEKKFDTAKVHKALDSMRLKYDFDASNNVTQGLYGTSFTAPYSGGYVAGQHELHPELSEYDLVAAALIASRPVTSVDTAGADDTAKPIAQNRSDEKRKTPSISSMIIRGPEAAKPEMPSTVTYKDNGAGIPFDQKRAGFGFLDFNTYATVVAAMADWQKADGSLKTEEKFVTTTIQSPKLRENAVVPGGYKAYSLKVDDDIRTLRTGLSLNLDPKSSPVYKIILRNPSGGEIIMNPHYIPPERVGSAPVLVSTNGFFGNDAKGEWQLLVSENVVLNSVDITISGTQKNGLIDKSMTHFSALKKETSYQIELKQADATQTNPSVLPKVELAY